MTYSLTDDNKTYLKQEFNKRYEQIIASEDTIISAIASKENLYYNNQPITAEEMYQAYINLPHPERTINPDDDNGYQLIDGIGRYQALVFQQTYNRSEIIEICILTEISGDLHNEYISQYINEANDDFEAFKNRKKNLDQFLKSCALQLYVYNKLYAATSFSELKTIARTLDTKHRRNINYTEAFKRFIASDMANFNKNQSHTHKLNSLWNSKNSVLSVARVMANYAGVFSLRLFKLKQHHNVSALAFAKELAGYRGFVEYEFNLQGPHNNIELKYYVLKFANNLKRINLHGEMAETLVFLLSQLNEAISSELLNTNASNPGQLHLT